MAFSLSTESADGREIEGAYWVPACINVDCAGKGGNITLHAYASAAAMDAGKAPIAGAVKSYSFTKEEFIAAQIISLKALFPDGVTEQNIMYEVLARFAYFIARSRKDLRDEDGTMRSFFDEALNI